MPSLPPPRLQGEGEGQGLQGRRARRRRVGLHGRARRGAAAAGVRDPRPARGRDHASASSSATATGCRRSRARSTPRISASCTPATSIRTISSEDEPVRHTVTNRAPEYHLADTAWGTQYAGYREAGPGQTYWRFGNFLFPFWTQAPNGEFGSHMHARAWVPLDDEHTMFCFLWWKRGTSRDDPCRSRPSRTARRSAAPGAATSCCPTRPTGSAAGGMAANAGNDWGIDREAQQSNTIYSGIDGIHLQDQAITESMGPIVDHEFEHLAPSDQMITRTRRRLLMAARALREGGTCRRASRTRRSIAAHAAATSSARTRAPGRRSMPNSSPRRCIRRRTPCARRNSRRRALRDGRGRHSPLQPHSCSPASPVDKRSRSSDRKRNKHKDRERVD